MGCERPGGIGANLWRDSNIRFPPNWKGQLPPAASRSDLELQLASGFERKKLTPEQVKEALDFFEQYEARYHEQAGQSYHRPCEGGAVVQGELGIYCAKCGKLPDLIPPECVRQ